MKAWQNSPTRTTTKEAEFAVVVYSVVTPVFNPPLDVFLETVASVRAQTFTDWELLLVDDASPDETLQAALANLERDPDPRIHVLRRQSNGGISAASNDAVNAARGEFIVLLDHDDLLTNDALASVEAARSAHPEADYFYSNEDILDPSGVFIRPFRKPDWSPERLRGQNYTRHLSVLRTSLVHEVGGFDAAFNGAQDHDLIFRVTERARDIVHIRRILYHWRHVPGSTPAGVEEKPAAWEAGRRAVQSHLDRIGLAATAELGPLAGQYRINRKIEDPPSVSIIVPTRGSAGKAWGRERVFVVEAIRSALARTTLTDIQIIVVLDEPAPVGLAYELRSLHDDVVVVPFTEPFNFSQKCNFGFAHARGDVIVLLNDDIEAASEGWLEELVAPLAEPDVGITAPKLLFEDDTIQFAGHRYGRSLGHFPYKVDNDSALRFGLLAVNREMSGTTGAVAAFRREVYEEVGGMSELLPNNFNDVDFSLKVGRAGYRILWMAHAVLYHFESQTREPESTPYEDGFIKRRWDIPNPSPDPYLG